MVTSGRELWWDVLLYAGSAIVAAGIGTTSTLATHQIWGYAAAAGYAGAAIIASGQLLMARAGYRRVSGTAGRTVVCALAWLTAAGLPLLLLVAGRAAGRPRQARGEVWVVEEAATRLFELGTPYLTRAAIAGLPPGERLHAYMPYQPGMALFGIPRALDPAAAGWSDARVWFALTAMTLLGLALLRWPGIPATAKVRALQLAVVAPPVTLAIATGGDDVPVLALCLLALSLAAQHRYGVAGLAIGAAGALKLIAWPVVVVLAVHAVAGRRHRALAGAVGLPLLAVLIDPAGVVEHVVRFPLGDGLVNTTARAPLPGYLIATYGGRPLAIGALVAAGAAFAWWLVRHPPRTAAAAATVSGYGLLAAIALLPASRPGYLLYPIALLAFARLSTKAAPVPRTGTEPPRRVPALVGAAG
jgi:Glycosyltransferase family 87